MRSAGGSYGGGLGDTLAAVLKAALAPRVWSPEERVSWQGAFDWDIRALKWLRGLCGSALADPRTDSGDRLRRCLWNAPLYLNCEGKTLSLAELDGQHDRSAKILFSRAPHPARGSGRWRGSIVWCLCQEDLSLLLARYTMEDVT